LLHYKCIKKHLKHCCLSRFSLAGAEGLEPSARGFGAAQKWYYLVSPNAMNPEKCSNYQ